MSRIFAGLIFINFAESPAPFETIVDDLAAPLAPYQLERAKVAHRQNYPIASNWKLAVENYCECYHCAPAHPEYSHGPWPCDSVRGDEAACSMKSCSARRPPVSRSTTSNIRG